MTSTFISLGPLALILSLMEVDPMAASRVTAEQMVQTSLETQGRQSELETRSNESESQQRWGSLSADQPDAEKFYDPCVMDREHGRDCALWSDANLGWKSLKTGSLVFTVGPSWQSYVIMSATWKSVSHTAVVAWLKWDDKKGYKDIVASYEEGAILGLVEVTVGAYQNIQSGFEGSGFQLNTFFGKVKGIPVGTQLFVKPRKKTMNEHQLASLRTISGCMHARRPDYVHRDVVKGFLKFWDKDSIIFRWHQMVTKTTTEAEEDYGRMICSQLVALIVMELDGPMQEVSGGVLHQGGSIQLSSEVDAPGCALLPGDFDPGDLKRMSLPTYGPVYELQLPWLHYPEYQALHAQQEALLAAHPPSRPWASFAQECKAGITALEYVRDYTPLWRRSMLSWLEDVNETFTNVLSFHDLTDHELYEIMSSPTGLDNLQTKLMCIRPQKRLKRSATID